MPGRKLRRAAQMMIDRVGACSAQQQAPRAVYEAQVRSSAQCAQLMHGNVRVKVLPRQIVLTNASARMRSTPFIFRLRTPPAAPNAVYAAAFVVHFTAICCRRHDCAASAVYRHFRRAAQRCPRVHKRRYSCRKRWRERCAFCGS